MSKELINNAMILIGAVFPYKQDQKWAKWSFKDSLTSPNPDKNYWLAVNSRGELGGITGLYLDSRDKDIWLGWFGVHPQHRRHGLGSMLLEFAISEARRRGFSVLKAYSSFDENERVAHLLYKKFGFIKIALDKKADKIIFQKNLNDIM